MKIVKTINILILSLIFAINCCAMSTSSENIVYEYDDISVEFIHDTKYTIEEQKVIADMILYGSDGQGVETYNIICDLFGHNLSTEYIQVTQHKVDDLAPRCMKKTYEANGCSRCDYFEYELISYIYIDCCPEE